MKTLTQHIQESLNNKPIKEVSKEKLLDENSASFRRVGPAKDSLLTRVTTGIEDDKKE
ncbi:hypothetical protein [Flavobacterium ajazii]|uniref:hypothetical protein n=1 Tax=Flavobacterium ajazii TaxID=2692318 RepID=UPI0013D78703|nr:hypothetical protein [Flavobacterium ajazii]